MQQALPVWGTQVDKPDKIPPLILIPANRSKQWIGGKESRRVVIQLLVFFLHILYTVGSILFLEKHKCVLFIWNFVPLPYTFLFDWLVLPNILPGVPKKASPKIQKDKCFSLKVTIRAWNKFSFVNVIDLGVLDLLSWSILTKYIPVLIQRLTASRLAVSLWILWINSKLNIWHISE